jgi:RimJ/RimL family protein N-acetyltransferase
VAAAPAPEAQRQLVDYLFATTPCHRIWAGTEVENIAEQRALERAGLLLEGRMRGGHFRDGQWRDSYIYGIHARLLAART